MKPLVIIPARGGSKGIPRKNIKLLDGKPLIQYTIEAAISVFPKELICISTDDFDIISVAEDCGLNVPFIRPNELAGDTIGTNEVLIHALEFYESMGILPDTIILLQPTSPFRNAEHIRSAIKHYNEDFDMLVSVKESNANPYFVLREENHEGWLVKSKDGDYNRRQDCPLVYEINGAIYIINVNSLKSKKISDFKKVKKYLMDEFSSHDIDNNFDWLVAEEISKQLKKYD